MDLWTLDACDLKSKDDKQTKTNKKSLNSTGMNTNKKTFFFL